MQHQKRSLFYDGSFEGFLNCIFTAFEQRYDVTGISTIERAQEGLFSSSEEVFTDREKSDRVKKGLLEKISSRGFKEFQFTFLSELPGIEMDLYHYAKQAFFSKSFSTTDYGSPVVIKIAQTAKKVSREKHRMEAFVRFKLTKENFYFAVIEPDFNVLPVIRSHFEARYADQKWIIYDIKRNFGIYYDLENTEYIQLETPPNKPYNFSSGDIFDQSEKEFESLCQNYFNSVNIGSRKNSRLHIQHVPTRYWKHLSEKRPLHK